MPTPPPAGGRVITVGDIHGCSAALGTLLGAIRLGPDDLVIPLGDIIDYGPDSRRVLEQLKALRDRTRLVLLTGNHEEMLFGVLDCGRGPEGWTRRRRDAGVLRGRSPPRSAAR